MMLSIAAATVFMSAPGQSFSVAAFVDPMLDDLHVDRTSYSITYTVATLIGGFTLPFVGRLVDRLGARIVLPVVAVGLGAACGWMSQLTSVMGLYVGFTMIRCLGQGSLTLISNWIIGEWFQAWRGRAAGICAIGGTLSVLIVPQVNNLLITEFGWRQAWGMLGIAVPAILVVPATIFLRDRPEALGLLPDSKFPSADALMPVSSQSPADDVGNTTVTKVERHSHSASVESSAASTVPVVDDQSFTVGEVLRCSAFWKIASVVATVSLVGTGLMFHQVSIVEDKGVSRTLALGSLGIQACAATASTVVAGYLVDRIATRFVLACSMLFEILALLLLLFLPGPNWVFVYSAVLGLHGGIIRSAGSIVWINYFGRQFQGAIQGVSMCIMVLAAALGPLPLAISRDYTGNYDAALWVFLVLPAMSGMAVLSASPPVRDQRAQI